MFAVTMTYVFGLLAITLAGVTKRAPVFASAMQAAGFGLVATSYFISTPETFHAFWGYLVWGLVVMAALCFLGSIASAMKS